MTAMGEENTVESKFSRANKDLTDYLLALDSLPDDYLAPATEKVEHCPCRTGCPECYGKLNCGCPDCWIPELKRGKKKRVSLDLLHMDMMDRIQDLEYSYCTISQVPEERVTVTKATVKTQDEERLGRRHGLSVRANNRWSLPSLPIKEKAQPVKKPREPLEARAVGPPKQVKYFCKHCKVDVCNACFSTVCSSHQVQWIGSSFFHCASPHHKIVHQHIEL